MEQLIITPKTKIFDLLEAYPRLEDVLISMAPQFVKLKNPILRKTIAKVATLSQAATIGGLKVEELINRLRAEVGQNSVMALDDENKHYNTLRPDWFRPENVIKHLDIREMLNAGEQPVNQVIADLNKLNAGDIYHVVAPFIPAPLIDKASSLEIDHWIDPKDNELFDVFFRKK